MTKLELLDLGREHILRWCSLNGVSAPSIQANHVSRPTFSVCAYYRSGVIYIWPQACAAIGMAGRAWSYPGYVIDRTPYGVLAHELGHHVECAHGNRGGIVARQWRRETHELPITGYCPNNNEWFAEIFRLFVTNPTLLQVLRPKMYARLAQRWPNPAEQRTWTEVIQAPRQLAAARNKVLQTERAAKDQT